MIRSFCCIFLYLLICSCEPDSGDSSISNPQDKQTLTTLPLVELDMPVLPENWLEVKSVSTDPFSESAFDVEPGIGTILCNENGAHLDLGIEHGDIELDIDFMVPKGSNSGIYFQGRYEVQILDSWLKTSLATQDCGAIYDAFDEEKKEVTHAGSPPALNATRAPGLWQSFNILFRAPKFDKNGQKTANAKFEHVYLNGQLIQKDVEVPLPTRAHMLSGEAATGSIYLQGDHGQVAYRNIQYKRMGTDTVGISNIQYQMFDRKMDYIPDFDTMTVSKSGIASNFDDLEELVGQQDGFALIFDADIDIPKDGEYLFTTMLDDGGDLYIDDELVVHNMGDPGVGTETGLKQLSKGPHKLRLTFFEEVWLALAVVYVEGPEMPKKTLASTDLFAIWNARGKNRKIMVDANDEPEIIRGYITHGNGKETYALSVGDPTHVNYSYDLVDGSLLRAWRGDFADVTNMWLGRGQSQLLLPRNAVMEFTDGVPVAKLSSANAAWSADRPADYKNKGYRLDAAGRPVFLSELGNTKIEDFIEPSEDGHLKRTVTIKGDGDASIWFSAAKANSIKDNGNGLVSVDSEYYINFPIDVNYKIRTSGASDQLLVSIENEIDYEIIW